jgi:bifunctional ADP-heptose synthase (sugar kinase/adenylyltransferase)
VRLIIFVKEANAGINRIRAINSLNQLLDNHSLKLETTNVLVISHYRQGVLKYLRVKVFVEKCRGLRLLSEKSRQH